VVLTDRGRSVLEASRDRDRDTGQAFYAGLKRERELEHDAQIYRAYDREAAKLEGLFLDELKELQPNPGFMRLVKEHVLRVRE